MGSVHSIDAYRAANEASKLAGPHLKSSGSGGTFDPMEARVAALEATTKRIEDKIDKILDKTGKVEVDLARLDGKVSTLPTTLQLFGFVIAVLAIAGLAKYLTP